MDKSALNVKTNTIKLIVNLFKMLTEEFYLFTSFTMMVGRVISTIKIYDVCRKVSFN